MRYLIGIDLGGTNVKMVAVCTDGVVKHETSFSTCDDPAARWTDAIVQRVTDIEQQLGTAAGIGVSSPGLAARDARSIAWMQGRLSAVTGLDWTNHLRRDAVVPVLNDAHAALLGESWIGASAGKRDVVMLTLGTGVGGAIMCDGRLLKGHLGRAGHLGHLSLDPDGARDIVNTPGSLEDAIGECTIRKRGAGQFASTKALVEAFAAGDADARSVWLKSVKALAAGVASIINAVDPEIVIIGGGISRAGGALFNPLREFLKEFEWCPTGESVSIVPAALGDKAGALGAAKAALESVSS